MNSEIPPVIPLYQNEMHEDGSVKIKKVKPLTYALMTWVKNYKGLEDTIDIADNENFAQWEIAYTNNDREFSIYFNTDETNGLIVLFIYYMGEEVFPENLLKAKELILEKNLAIPVGQFQLVGDGKVLRYSSGVSVGGIASPDPDYSGPHLISPQLIENMFEEGTYAMDNFIDEFSDVAFYTN